MLSIRKILLCASLLGVASLQAVARECQVFADVGVAPTRNVGNVSGLTQSGERDASPGFGLGCSSARGFGFELAHVRLAEVRAEFANFGSPPLLSGSDRPESSALYATYRFQSTEGRWHAGAKLGVHRWTFDTVVAGEGEFDVFPLSYSNIDATLGIDLGYALSKHWSTGIGWTEYALHDASDSRVALRVAYHFR